MQSTDNRCKNPVFFISVALSLIIALWGIFGSNSFSTLSEYLMQGLKENFSWLYLGVELLFVLFCLAIAFSKWGKVRLGSDDEKPGYSTVSWFAMLFGAGMGIGLVFWSVAEPLSHYIAPMAGIEPGTPESARFAMRSCFMHWGLHPWACYAVLGLCLAYFQFRKTKSALISNLISPLTGSGKFGRFFGTGVDVYTTILTTIGVATSFGMGCLQICEGLNYMFGVPNNVFIWLTLIAAICVIYLKSAISGVDSGIKKLSDINLVLFVGLMIAAFLAAPGTDTLKLGLQGLGDYIINFFPDSLRMSSQGDSTWIRNWRVFYWAWWLSWAPFVGIFIARISRGRTIREFVLGVIIVPSLVSILWFTVFGNLTLKVTSNFSPEALQAMAASPQTALFHIFGEYSWGMLLSVIAIALLITFFITSANSATFVLAMLTSNGQLEPPNTRKAFWGILIAIMAFALILSGGIEVIQTLSIVIAFPYLFILIMICASLIKALKSEQSKPPVERVV